jgi:hypothetical protein
MPYSLLTADKALIDGVFDVFTSVATKGTRWVPSGAQQTIPRHTAPSMDMGFSNREYLRTPTPIPHFHLPFISTYAP